jgi:L-alanine-DL-glutamate epimerase-like enolase superfamily enzyme
MFEGFDVHAGELAVPDGPGLGVEPAAEFLERCRIA